MALNVLIIEDDESMRRALVDIFGILHYPVTCVDNGEKGVALFREKPEAYGVVLLDVRLPGMKAEDVMRELRRIRPSLPVVLTSGYDEATVRPRFAKLEPFVFLAKPYDMERLVQLVRPHLNSISVHGANSSLK